VEPFRTTRILAEDNAGLVYVGRLEPDKGVGELVAAAARTGQALTLEKEAPRASRVSKGPRGSRRSLSEDLVSVVASTTF
jgi:hypothetical protein